MRREYGQYNAKRRICAVSEGTLERCAALAARIQYGGNPEHKQNPGDFGLTPPAGPRPGKSLCDDSAIFTRKAALAYLKDGLTQGLVSERFNGQWPQNIWAVMGNGQALEAQLENSELGSYHGYPLPESDPFAVQVVQQWKERRDRTQV